MAAYVYGAHEATCLLKHFLITHIPRSKKRQVDALSIANSLEDGKPKRIEWETQFETSIEPHEFLWLDKSSS